MSAVGYGFTIMKDRYQSNGDKPPLMGIDSTETCH